MAAKSKKTKSKPQKRKYTKSKPKTKVVYRTKPQTKSSASEDVNDMTRSIGKLAITGAGTIMALGIAGGIANAFKK